eukprot:gene16664-biopygen9330
MTECAGMFNGSGLEDMRGAQRRREPKGVLRRRGDRPGGPERHTKRSATAGAIGQERPIGAHGARRPQGRSARSVQ